MVIVQESDQLAVVSARCFFRTLHHCLTTDPTSNTLIDLRRRYNGVFPLDISVSDLPFPHIMSMIHVMVNGDLRHRHCIQWHDDRSSARERIPLAQSIVEVAQSMCQQTQHAKVPCWILRFALNFLSLDPPSPISVIADCLTTIAVDLSCDDPNITALDERCVCAR